MKNDRIELRVPAELKTALVRQAEANGQTLTEYLNDIIAVRGESFVWCPKCKLPVFDKKKVPVTGSAKIKCTCGFKWTYTFND